MPLFLGEAALHGGHPGDGACRRPSTAMDWLARTGATETPTSPPLPGTPPLTASGADRCTVELLAELTLNLVESFLRNLSKSCHRVVAQSNVNSLFFFFNKCVLVLPFLRQGFCY